MPLHESEAIILRWYPMGEGDRLVSFLSRSYGRMRGVAHGARRTKSRFGSTLEPLSYVRIWFFERETRELVRINQCELLESFLKFQSDYQTGLALALMSELTEAVLPEREASDPAFRLLLMAVRGAMNEAQSRLALLYFTLWTVRLAGWLPNLSACSVCGKGMAGEGGFVSVTRPGLSCAACRKPGLRSIEPASLALAQEMLDRRLDQLMAEGRQAAAGSDLQRYLLDVVEQQIERKLTARTMMETA